MSEPESTYPQFPPGFWRRVVLHPDKGWIGGAIEDDMHHFRIRFDHSDGVIVAARSSALSTKAPMARAPPLGFGALLNMTCPLRASASRHVRTVAESPLAR